MTVFRTKRLSVRKATANDRDVELFYRLWTTPAVMKNVGFPSGLRTTREEIRRIIANEDVTPFDTKLIVELRDTQVPIGECKLGHPREDRISETDVKLLPDHWGYRYGREIKQGLLNYLFVYTDCLAVDASPNRGNIASQRMQEAVGGKKIGEGVFRFPEHMRDLTVDVPYYHYRVFRADWERQQKESTHRIRGEKVSLRTTIPQDLADYRRWNSPALPAWKFDGPWFTDDLSRIIESRKRWIIGDRETPYRSLEIEDQREVHLGWVVVYHRPDDLHKTEFGIDICEDTFWGHGIGTEACTLWLNYLFQEFGLTRIGFSSWEGNTRMLALGTKLGFVEEARLRRACKVEGRFWDRIKMGILRHEWEMHMKSSHEPGA